MEKLIYQVCLILVWDFELIFSAFACSWVPGVWPKAYHQTDLKKRLQFRSGHYKASVELALFWYKYWQRYLALGKGNELWKSSLWKSAIGFGGYSDIVKLSFSVQCSERAMTAVVSHWLKFLPCSWKHILMFIFICLYIFSYAYFYILQTSSENYKLLFIIDILSVVKFILVSSSLLRWWYILWYWFWLNLYDFKTYTYKTDACIYLTGLLSYSWYYPILSLQSEYWIYPSPPKFPYALL